MGLKDHPLSESPYKGLMPYSEEDAPFFFGREDEQELIIANLMASRLTLLYGASGVGKSSALHAGVAYRLRQLAQQNLAEHDSPELAVVVFSSWRDDPLVGLANQIENSVTQMLSGQTVEPVPPSRSLVQILQGWTERVGGDLLIILDQFEEYFLYHPQEDGEGTFAVEFPRAVNHPDLRVSFLVATREDALAKLDRFKGRIPNLFDNYLRIDHLDRESARAAIRRPIDIYNEVSRQRAPDGPRISIEEELVEAVLDQVEIGRVALGETGRGVVGADTSPSPTEAQVETPYLQLVMERLWNEEMGKDSHTLRLTTLTSLGGAERVVRTHLDDVMNALSPTEQETAARIFYHLVTPGGTKIVHSVHDLAEFAGLERAQLTSVLDQLSSQDVRILRSVPPPLDQPDEPHFEIFHDVLAQGILDWRTRYVQAQQREEAERQLAGERRRVARLWLVLIGSSLVLIGMVGLAIFAFLQWNTAQDKTQEAEEQAQIAETERTRAQEQAQIARLAEEQAVVAQQEAVQQAQIAQIAQQEAVTAREKADELAKIAEEERAKAETAAQLAEDERTKAVDAANIAEKERAKAVDAANLAEEERAKADEAQRIAEDLQQQAETEARVVTSRQLAKLADLEAHHPRSLLLSVEAVNVTLKAGEPAIPAAEGALRRALSNSGGLTLGGHENFISAVAISPDGRWVVTGSWDSTARLWDLTAPDPAAKPIVLRGQERDVNTVAISPDNRWLVTSSWDATARLWDLTATDPANGPIVLTGHESSINFVAVSSDSRWVVTGSWDSTARLWDLTAPDPAAKPIVLRGQERDVNTVAISPDNRWLVTSSGDATARL